MCETEDDSSYFTFPKDFKKQCSCGKENVYYFCTYEKCKKFGLICSLCIFYEHSDHARFCIPIQLYKIEKLNTHWMTNFKEFLIQKKEEINKMIDEQIRFIEEIEKASTIEELLQLDVVPKYSTYPQIVNQQHIIKNISFLNNISTVVHENIKRLRSKIEEMLAELKQDFFYVKQIQILNRNPIQFDSFSDYYPCEFKFSFKSKESFYLKGIGYSSEITESLKSYGRISIQEMENEVYLLPPQSISDYQKVPFPSLPNIAVIFFNLYLKISKDKEYVVTIDYNCPRHYNYGYSQQYKTVFWMGNLKYDSMEFNISAGNQSNREYISHLFIM